jgi:hypothetical protein
MDKACQWFPKWVVLPPGERWDYLAALQETPEVGSSKRIVRLFTAEVTLNQTL